MHRSLTSFLHYLCKWRSSRIPLTFRGSSNYWCSLLDAFPGCRTLQCKDMRRNCPSSLWTQTGCYYICYYDLHISWLRCWIYGRAKDPPPRDDLKNAWHQSSIFLINNRTRLVCLGFYCQFRCDSPAGTSQRFRVIKVQQYFEL